MFFTNDKNFFLEAKITIFVSLVIWFTITEYFPLHVKGSVGIFEGPHLFGQFPLVSSVRVSEVVRKMVILARSSNFQNCIKKTNKIPEYARDYKKEYLLIIGINKEFRYFVEHIHESPIGLFENQKVVRIKYFIKRFLKGQERGKLQDISSLILRKYDFSNVEDLYQNMKYDFEEDGTRCDDNPGYSDFYELFCKFYEKIKIEYDGDEEYMFPIDYYSIRNDSEDSEDSDTD